MWLQPFATPWLKHNLNPLGTTLTKLPFSKGKYFTALIGAPDESLAVAEQQVQSLKNGSKEIVGYGYVIEWQERNSRHHKRNLFLDRVVFESPPDFLRLIGKQWAGWHTVLVFIDVGTQRWESGA